MVVARGGHHPQGGWGATRAGHDQAAPGMGGHSTVQANGQDLLYVQTLLTVPPGGGVSTTFTHAV